MHLLTGFSKGQDALLGLLENGALRIGFHIDVSALRKLHQKYRDRPMSLADACLVRMTEVYSDPILLTTDTDFRIYRRHGRQTIPSAMPR